VMQILDPSHKQLEALYNHAFAFVFPSRFEGFGWPVIEAQACGCPVLISDRCSLPEVADGTAMMRPVEDEAGFAEDLIRLTRDGEREFWVNRGLVNTQRFSTQSMLKQYEAVYRKLTTQ
jgi:glycosyltransferase involved in cell wall biosynthesis